MNLWNIILATCAALTGLFVALFFLGNYYSRTQDIPSAYSINAELKESDNVLHDNRDNKQIQNDRQEHVVEYSPKLMARTHTTDVSSFNQNSEYVDDSKRTPLSATHNRGQYTLKKPLDTYLLFFVLDDAGSSMEQVRPYFDFKGTVTFAVLPFLSHSSRIALALQNKNIPYILHMPMQPIGTEDPGDYVLKISYTEDITSNLILRSLESVKGSIGINNHMGSLATTNRELMKTVLKTVKERNIFFLDSRTSADTIAEELAYEFGMSIIVRDIFIDNVNNQDYISTQIKKGMQIAKEKGFAVLIGHTTKEHTFYAIRSMYPRIVKDGGMLLGLNTFFDYIEISYTH